MFAFLVQALLSSVAYAGSSHRFLGEICTASGLRSPVPSETGEDISLQKHCVVCATASLLALPPSTKVFAAFRVLAEQVLPALELVHFSPRLFAFPVRGPPSLA